MPKKVVDVCSYYLCFTVCSTEGCSAGVNPAKNTATKKFFEKQETEMSRINRDSESDDHIITFAAMVFL